MDTINTPIIYELPAIVTHCDWSKRKRDGRKLVSWYLLDWLRSRPVIFQSEFKSDIECGFFEKKQEGEDKFDAMIGLFSMLDVIWRLISEGAPNNLSITCWEGWVLGQSFNDYAG